MLVSGRIGVSSRLTVFSTAIETSTKLVQPFGRTFLEHLNIPYINYISICHHFLQVPF